MEEITRVLRIAFLFCLLFTNNLKMCACESNDTVTNKTVTITHPRIVIVGAGPSGIAAAAKLLENGFKNVTILEAEDRIGGRVYTSKIGILYVAFNIFTHKSIRIGQSMVFV